MSTVVYLLIWRVSGILRGIFYRDAAEAEEDRADVARYDGLSGVRVLEFADVDVSRLVRPPGSLTRAEYQSAVAPVPETTSPSAESEGGLTGVASDMDLLVEHMAAEGDRMIAAVHDRETEALREQIAALTKTIDEQERGRHEILAIVGALKAELARFTAPVDVEAEVNSLCKDPKYANIANVYIRSIATPIFERVAQLAREVERLRGPKDPLMRVCVVGLVTDPAGRLLLVLNKTRGGWELPGGKLQRRPCGRMEPWREGLHRELKEETGLDVALADGRPYDVRDGVPLPGAAYASIILVVRGRAEGEPVAGDDAQEARWFAIDEIPWSDLSRIGSAETVRAWAREHVGTGGPTTAFERLEVDRQDMAPGWAVFSGSDGEDPELCAFFPGSGGQDLAQRLLEAETCDGDPVIFGGCVVPAILVSGLGTDGGLFVSNHYNDAKAIAAMARAWRRDPGEW